jgi:hypothetical protein
LSTKGLPDSGAPPTIDLPPTGTPEDPAEKSPAHASASSIARENLRY